MKILVLAYLIYLFVWTPKWLYRFSDNLKKTMKEALDDKRKERENENNE